MRYHIKVKELDDAVDYPLIVLAGMTGLGMDTIRQLIDHGVLQTVTGGSEIRINGKHFKEWAQSVDNEIEVEKTDCSTMPVNE